MNMTEFLLLKALILSEGFDAVVDTDPNYHKQEANKQFINGLGRDLFIYVSSDYSSGNTT